MGISWVVIITESDSVVQKYGFDKTPIEILLDAGIIPIIRDQRKLPKKFINGPTVEKTVEIYAKYGLRPFWILYNEPFDSREWSKEVPSKEEGWPIIADRWVDGASQVAALGGYVGFPDGPSYDENPFERIKAAGGQWLFDQGHAFYTGHHYGKNRHRDYPYDAVTRFGAQLTEDDYDRLLDDYADDPTWKEEPLELLNQRRAELTNPGLTPLEDDVGWRGWEKIAKWSVDSFGYVVPMAMTEGGWVPRDRPGSGPNTDIRQPHTTPRMVGKKTLQMFETPSPFFAIAPWILASGDMGGASWEFDSWVTWAYEDKYGREKPVVATLESHPPKSGNDPMVIDVHGDLRDMDWVASEYGASVVRGKESAGRLLEVHESAGVAALEVWVVDQHGMPLENAEFYLFHEDASPRDCETLDRGELFVSDANGRITVPLPEGEERCGPGSCSQALWPKGGGDALTGLGVLPGGESRHLLGLWRIAVEVSDAGQ
jgi:hypothetical protein